MPPAPRNLLTRSELADHLRRSPNHVSVMIAQGRLPPMLSGIQLHDMRRVELWLALGPVAGEEAWRAEIMQPCPDHD